jgi:hypothetical protein
MFLGKPWPFRHRMNEKEETGAAVLPKVQQIHSRHLLAIQSGKVARRCGERS